MCICGHELDEHSASGECQAENEDGTKCTCRAYDGDEEESGSSMYRDAYKHTIAMALREGPKTYDEIMQYAHHEFGWADVAAANVPLNEALNEMLGERTVTRHDDGTYTFDDPTAYLFFKEAKDVLDQLFISSAQAEELKRRGELLRTDEVAEQPDQTSSPQQPQRRMSRKEKLEHVREGILRSWSGEKGAKRKKAQGKRSRSWWNSEAGERERQRRKKK